VTFKNGNGCIWSVSRRFLNALYPLLSGRADLNRRVRRVRGQSSGPVAVEVLLDRRRRVSAGALETAMVTLQGLGFGLIPALLLWHSKLVEPALWFIGGSGLVVALLAATLVAWRLFGRELVELQDGVLRGVWRVGPLARHWVVPLQQITEVSFVPCERRDIPNNIFGFGHTSLMVTSGARRVRCCVALGGQAVETVAERIRAAAEKQGAAER